MAKISLQQGLPKELQMSARELKTQRRTDEGAAKRAAFSSVRREGPADLLTLLKESETGRQRRPAPDRYQKFRPLRQLQLRMDLKNLRHSTTSRLWGRLDIDLLKCTNCQICTKVCPTGALNAYHDNGAQGIDFAPYLCTNCRLCQDSCYPHAINIADGCDLEDLAEASLYRFELRPASPAPNSMHTNEANESSDLKADVCPVTERF
jgi:formate hydrogenlyase subunit 6/NADH:ubiquinone oxidoreductase subunit I